MFVRLFNYHVSKFPLNIGRDWIKRESKSIYQYDNHACQLTKVLDYTSWIIIFSNIKLLILNKKKIDELSDFQRD